MRCARRARMQRPGLDVTRSDQVERVVGEIEERLGPVAHLVNVAGSFHADRCSNSPTMAGSRVRDQRARRVLLLAGSRTPHARTPQRRDRDDRLARCDLGAHEPRRLRRLQSCGILADQMLRLELAPYGIRCNVVHPGVTSTPPALERFGGDEARFHAHHAAGDPAIFRAPIPLGKAGRPETPHRRCSFFYPTKPVTSRWKTSSSMVEQR